MKELSVIFWGMGIISLLANIFARDSSGALSFGLISLVIGGIFWLIGSSRKKNSN